MTEKTAWSLELAYSAPDRFQDANLLSAADVKKFSWLGLRWVSVINPADAG